MARKFTEVSSNSGKYSGALVTGTPLSMVAWVRLAAVGSVIRTILSIRNSASGVENNCWTLGMGVGEQIEAKTGTSTTQGSTTAGALTPGTWAHAGAVFSTYENRVAYLDGVAATANLSIRSPSSVNVTNIGYEETSAGGALFWDGDLAELAVYDAALTTAEMLILSKGISPLFVRPSNLVGYWPFIGNTSPEIELINRYALTLTGPPTKSAHPRVLWPRARIYSFPSGAIVKFIVDAGAGADAAPSVSVSLGLSDTGAGVDTAPGAAAAVPVADTGSAADLIAAISAALSLTDTASGADAVSIITDVLLSVTDSGTAADVIASILASLSVSDVGTGVEAITNLSASLSIADTGAGVDATPTIAALLALSDTAVGADAPPAIAALLALSDTAVGADAINVLQAILISIADNLIGADAISLTAAVSLSDTATGVDILQSVAALLALADSGIGIDVAARFDAQVRLLKMTFTVRMRRIAFRMAKRFMSFKLAA